MGDYASNSNLYWDEMYSMASVFDVLDEGWIFVGLVFSGLVKSLFPGAGQFNDDDAVGLLTEN